MRLSRKLCFTLASVGAVIILTALLVAITLSIRDRPENLFARFVIASAPQSVKILDSDFVSGRECRVFFHVQISSQDFPAILAAKQYKRLQANSTTYKAFIETTYQRFKNKLPTEAALIAYEVYEVWSDPGTVSYLVVNPDHSELFAFSVRL